MTVEERAAWSWRGLLLPAVVLVVSWGLFLGDRAPGTSAALTGFPLDDAWIHQVYARSLAREGGFHYNTGVPESGMTSPLWVVLLAPLHLAARGHTLPIVIGTKVLELLLGLVGMAMLRAIALELGLGGLAGFLAALLFAADPSLGFARVSGMEVPLFIALSLCAVWLSLRGRVVACGAIAGLSVVARPEGIVLLPLYALAALHARRGRSPGARAIALGVALAVFPAAIYSLFCMHAAGTPLPNSFYVKFAAVNPLSPARLAFVFKHYVHGDLPYFTLEAGTLAGLLGCARVLRRGGIRGALVLCVGLVTLLAAIASRGFPSGHYFYWERWIVPWCPYLLLAIAAGIEELRFGFDSLRGMAARTAHPRRAVAAWGVAAGLLACGVFAPVPRALSERADTFAWNAQNIEELNVAPGRWIDANLPRDAVVAVNDAGALRYFGGRTTIDLIGLNDHRILRLDPSRGVQPLLAMGIDYVVVFPMIYGNLVRQLPVTPVHSVRAPHYTICDAPQDVVTVYRMHPQLTSP